MFYARCKQCGIRFGAKTRSRLLDKIRKHSWQVHKPFMHRRIKDGIRAAQEKRVETARDLGDILEAINKYSGYGVGRLANIGTGVTQEPLAGIQRAIATGILMATGVTRKPAMAGLRQLKRLLLGTGK